jgi:hypothetical protein
VAEDLCFIHPFLLAKLQQRFVVVELQKRLAGRIPVWLAFSGRGMAEQLSFFTSQKAVDRKATGSAISRKMVLTMHAEPVGDAALLRECDKGFGIASRTDVRIAKQGGGTFP